MVDHTKATGLASSKICPRQGIAFLHPDNKSILAVPTNCKSWSCKSCRDRKLGMVAQLMQYGLSHFPEAFLVSITYLASGPRNEPARNPVNAKSAEADYKALVRILRRDLTFMKMATFRVVELTKRKQIHFHLLMGNLNGTLTDNCTPRKARDWKKLPKLACPCLMCTISRAWTKVTKTSKVVDCTRIYDPAGAAWYLCKYLRKGMYGKQRQILTERGYTRRYFRTANFAGDVQLRRRGTVEKKWTRTSFMYGRHILPSLLEQSEDHPLMEQMGTPLAIDLSEEIRRKALATLYAKIRNAGRSRRL